MSTYEHEPHPRKKVVSVRLSPFELGRLDLVCDLYGGASRAWVLRQGLAVVASLVDAGEPISAEE